MKRWPTISIPCRTPELPWAWAASATGPGPAFSPGDCRGEGDFRGGYGAGLGPPAGSGAAAGLVQRQRRRPLADAWNRGAQVYLTGEVRHHQVWPGPQDGLAVVAVGHYVSEAIFMEPWSRQLQSLCQEAGMALKIMAAAGQATPCGYL